MQVEKVLFLAEGLLMYLPKKEVVRLFNRLSRNFRHSRILFEVVNERYTRGIWKKMVVFKMKRSLGSDAGASYSFGVRDAKEIESYGSGIRVAGEWSYFEEKEIKPSLLKLFRHLKFLTRTQWTVMAEIC